MKTIEKENGQIFEVYTSRKEFGEMVKGIMFDLDSNNIWVDEDSSLYLEYSDGSTLSVMEGDKVKALRLNEVVRGIYNNPCTQAIYNCTIVFNDKYEDWEIAEQ